MDALDAKSALVDLASAVVEYASTRDAYLETAGRLPREESDMLLRQLDHRRYEMTVLARKALANAAACAHS